MGDLTGNGRAGTSARQLAYAGLGVALLAAGVAGGSGSLPYGLVACLAVAGMGITLEGVGDAVPVEGPARWLALAAVACLVAWAAVAMRSAAPALTVEARSAGVMLAAYSAAAWAAGVGLCWGAAWRVHGRVASVLHGS